MQKIMTKTFFAEKFHPKPSVRIIVKKKLKAKNFFIKLLNRQTHYIIK